MAVRTIVRTLSAVTILALPVASKAQQAMGLTALDYIQIQQLVARYASRLREPHHYAHARGCSRHGGYDAAVRIMRRTMPQRVLSRRREETTSAAMTAGRAADSALESERR